MPISIDDIDEARESRRKRWEQARAFMERAEDGAPRVEQNRTQSASLRQATEMDAKPQAIQPQNPAATSDKVERPPQQRDWMTRVGASNPGSGSRSMRGNDPKEEPLSADALKGASSAHEELTDVFGDEAETIERQDAQLLNFVHKRTPASVAGKEQALAMATVLSKREDIMQRAEAAAAGDQEKQAKLAPYRQWSNALVGRAETKVRYLLDDDR